MPVLITPIQHLPSGPRELTPSEVVSRWRDLPGLVFFDTAREPERVTGNGRTAARPALSLIAAVPSRILTGRTPADWEALRRAVAERQLANGSISGIPDGFAAGWVDYDGAFCFGFYDGLLAFRHSDRAWFSVGGMCPELHIGGAPGGGRYDAGSFRFVPEMNRGTFLAMVRRAQEYIAAGDIYQVNLAHRWATGKESPAGLALDPFPFYRALRRCSPSPHCAFLALNGRTVCSSSPELFLEMDGRRIRTQPIKGTRPRRAGAEADAQSAHDLVTSPKEIAELVMITDLERNDLGKLCEFGSVTVKEMLKLERHEQVFHMVSTVEGQLRLEVDAVTALRACFPGGSITGAPKKRAMEIIAELEPVPRGLYTGAIGYFGFNGVSQFSIAIRTVVMEGGRAHFHAGAGIVADSQPEQEWQETLDKASGILLAAGRV